MEYLWESKYEQARYLYYFTMERLGVEMIEVDKGQQS